MNRLYCLIVMFFICTVCQAQNLVPNPSFEDTVYCPSSVTQLSACTNWSSVLETPDYFNSCSGVSQVGVPYNMTGFQNARTGNGYCGFFVLFFQSTCESMGAQLLSPLIVGQKYFVSFYLNRAMGNTAFNKIGVLFSTSATNYLQYPLPNFAHIYSDSIITDTLNWTLVKGSFIADSAYSYIDVGCFFDINHVDSINLGSSASFGYYFVDDIVVSTDSTLTLGTKENPLQEPILIFPNPFTDKIDITTKTNELVEVHLFDVAGRKIFNRTFTNSISINTAQLAKGIYLYEVRSKYGVIKKGKVVKE